MNDVPEIAVYGFKTVYKQNAYGETIGRDMVHYGPRFGADKNRVWNYISEIKPDEKKLGDNEQKSMKKGFMHLRWKFIQPHYDAWKEGHELPENGTAIGAWPALSPEQASVFLAGGVKTVEDVAGLPESALSQIKLPDVRSLQRQAKAFLESKDKTDTAKAIADLQDKNEALSQQLEAAMELLEQRVETEKPKRGRPPKPKNEASSEDGEVKEQA